MPDSLVPFDLPYCSVTDLNLAAQSPLSSVLNSHILVKGAQHGPEMPLKWKKVRTRELPNRCRTKPIMEGRKYAYTPWEITGLDKNTIKEAQFPSAETSDELLETQGRK